MPAKNRGSIKSNADAIIFHTVVYFQMKTNNLDGR